MEKLRGLPTALRLLCDRDPKARSLRQLSREAQLGSGALSRWFSGSQSPSIDGLDRLLQVLDVSLSDLAATLIEVQSGADHASEPAIEGRRAEEMGEAIGRAVSKVLIEMGIGAEPTQRLRRTMASAAERSKERGRTDLAKRNKS